MAYDIKRCVSPSIDLYKFLVENQYGEAKDLDDNHNFNSDELNAAYRLGYLSSGIDGEDCARYRLTEKGLRHAKISIAIDGLVNSMEKAVKL